MEIKVEGRKNAAQIFKVKRQEVRGWIKIGCWVMVAVAMVGCRPPNVLSNNEMRDVLYDLHRVDGALQVAGYNYGHDEEVAAYYKDVLDDHGITQAEFDSSLVWFTDNPQIFNKIYPRVIDRLEEATEIEKQRRDSARIANKDLLPMMNDEEVVPIKRRDIEEVKREMREGYANVWKEWVPEEFSEQGVVMFNPQCIDTIVALDSVVVADSIAVVETKEAADTLVPLKKLKTQPINSGLLQNTRR